VGWLSDFQLVAFEIVLTLGDLIKYARMPAGRSASLSCGGLGKNGA
jgi:hypothetical protein